MTDRALILFFVATACGKHDSTEVAKLDPSAPIAAQLAVFESAWERARKCLYGTRPGVLDLDPRDALPLVGGWGEDEMGGCADLDALVAMVPPSVPLLDAAVRELPELWRDVFSHDDTGRHTNYSELEAFANGLRDADDMRVAARRAAQVEATPLPTRRIPDANCPGAGPCPPHRHATLS